MIYLLIDPDFESSSAVPWPGSRQEISQVAGQILQTWKTNGKHGKVQIILPGQIRPFYKVEV